MGKVSEWDLLPAGKAASKAQRVRQQLVDPEERQRLAAQAQFAYGQGEPAFPPPPPAPLAGAPPAAEAADAAGQGVGEVQLRNFEAPLSDVLKL